MMTREQAAKYMIVAWVKDWNLLTYLQVVTGLAKPDCMEAHKQFEWLPHGLVSFRKKYARRFIADNFQDLNNRLWDANDDKARLALFPLVMRKVGATHKNKSDRSRYELIKTNNDLRKAYIAEQLSVDAMRKGSGHHWNVVK